MEMGNMVYRLLPALAIMLIVHKGVTQNRQAGGVRNSMEFISEGVNPNSNSLFGKTLPTPPPEGNYFYEYEWRPTTFILPDGDTLGQSDAIYNIKENTFYLKLDEKDLRILKGQYVKQFSWIIPRTGEKQDFVYSNLYNSGDVSQGYYRIIQDGTVQLVTRRYTRIKKADYIEGLSAGRNYDRIMKDDLYFLAYNGNLMDLTGKVKKDQETIDLIGSELNLKTFLKETKANLKEESGLKLLAQTLSERLTLN